MKVFTFLVETFPAEFTHERFVAGVDPDVRVERRAPVERFSTLVTFVRLFLHGDHDMHINNDEGGKCYVCLNRFRKKMRGV